MDCPGFEPVLGRTAAVCSKHKVGGSPLIATDCVVDALLMALLMLTKGLEGRAQVATVEDPASARLGESLYSFIPRSVIGNLQDGVSAEVARMQTLNLPFWSLHNRCVRTTSQYPSMP